MLVLQWLPHLLSRTWVQTVVFSSALSDLSDPIRSAAMSVAPFRAAPSDWTSGLLPITILWCRPSSSPAGTVISWHSNQCLGLPHVLLLSAAPTNTLTRRILEADPLSDHSQATRCLCPSLSNKPDQPLWPVVNGNCGCTYNFCAGHYTCLRHFPVHWPQAQLVTSSIQFYILSVSAPPLSLPQLRSLSNLDDSKSLPIGLHGAKLVPLWSSPYTDAKGVFGGKPSWS